MHKIPDEEKDAWLQRIAAYERAQRRHRYKLLVLVAAACVVQLVFIYMRS